ncbi:MAG: 30S ribosomal protein S4 [Acidobacteriota bacterium]|nr:30S ribosomal protein S4 [Acidobacteriota bacterium]
MNYTGPKVRLSRKLGIAITPKADKYLEKKPYPPGAHGFRRRRRLSPYGTQLIEKQRLRYQYNVAERQMRNYFRRAARRRGMTGENLVQILETRLDSLVLRSRFARTIYQARQVVTHRHILVNDKIVKSPSYQVKPGDKISVKEGSRKMRAFNEGVMTTALPPYLNVDDTGYTAEMTYLPPRGEVPVVCEVQLVVEFYSR